MHTIVSDGATGFAGRPGRVAAAALLSNGHSGLLAAFAAKANEYVLEPAAASVAALAGHVLDTLLLASGALAGISSTRTICTRQLQQQLRCLGSSFAFLSPSACPSLRWYLLATLEAGTRQGEAKVHI